MPGLLNTRIINLWPTLYPMTLPFTLRRSFWLLTTSCQISVNISAQAHYFEISIELNNERERMSLFNISTCGIPAQRLINRNQQSQALLDNLRSIHYGYSTTSKYHSSKRLYVSSTVDLYHNASVKATCAHQQRKKHTTTTLLPDTIRSLLPHHSQ